MEALKRAEKGDAVMLAQVLDKCSENTQIALAVLLSIGAMCGDGRDAPARRVEFGAGGALPRVVMAMRARTGDAELQGAGIMAMHALAIDNHKNTAALGEAGAAETITAAMTAHPTDGALQAAGCKAIKVLAVDPQNVHELGCCGSCGAVVHAMHGFPQDRDVQYHACWAIFKLAALPEARRDQIVIVFR